MRVPGTVAVAALLFTLALSLTGCSTMTITAGPSTHSGIALQGQVHGGQQPVSGSHIYLFAANTTNALGAPTSSTNSSISLLTTGTMDTNGNYYVTSDPGGNFSITGDYACASGQQVYLYAVGGSAGTDMPANSAIGLMAVLGNCPGGTSAFLSTYPFIIINELTTVSAAYAMAGYAYDSTHVSSTINPLAITGIANAFANAGNLVDITSGTALTAPPSNPSEGTVPQQEINTLGNILAACINSDISSSGNCANLFTWAQSSGTSGTMPTDTATAAINIAHNPGANVSNLCSLQATTGAPFQTSLSCSSGNYPNDFTVAITYSNINDIFNPNYIAVDSSGSVWVSENGSGEISKFNANGSPAAGSPFSAGTLNSPQQIAIDATGNAWVTDSAEDDILELSSSGALAQTASSSDLFAPWAIAIDASNNIWVTDEYTDVLSEFNSGGTNTNNFSNSNLSGSLSVAIDGSGDVWIPSAANDSLMEFLSNGSPAANTPFGVTPSANMQAPYGVALDASNNVWVTNRDGDAISEFNSSGTNLSGTGYGGGGDIGYGGNAGPWAVAIDGAGNAWIANSNIGYLSEFSSNGTALSPFTGLANAYFGVSGFTNTVAIDGSGNVWTADYINNIVIELVGAATPVVTPLVGNLVSPYTHPASIP